MPSGPNLEIDNQSFDDEPSTSTASGSNLEEAQQSFNEKPSTLESMMKGQP